MKLLPKKLILHETHDKPTPSVNRTLVSVKIDSDAKMVAFHDYMVKGYDIITQFEIEGACYVLLQHLQTIALKEALETEKAERDKKAKKKK